MYDWRKKEFMQDKVTDYLNRNPADISQDPAFQKYRDQYLKIGQQINADTAKLVDQYAGGYDNTYAQNVGKQAYQKYVAQLNNIAPSFQSAAEARYKGQGDQMLQQLSLAQSIWDREHQPVSFDYGYNNQPVQMSNEDILGPYIGLTDIGMLTPDQWRASGDKEFASYEDYASSFMQDMTKEGVWAPEIGLLIKPELMKEYLKMTQGNRKNYGTIK